MFKSDWYALTEDAVCERELRAKDTQFKNLQINEPPFLLQPEESLQFAIERRISRDKNPAIKLRTIDQFQLVFQYASLVPTREISTRSVRYCD